MKDNLEVQLNALRHLLKPGNIRPTPEALAQVRAFLEKFPRELTEEESREFRLLIKKAFGLHDPKDVEGPTEPFEELIPARGWLRKYYEYTLGSEPPAVFHFMCALTVLGASLERGVYFDKGFYRVYPNMATVLIAPTGRCRKTSATNIALSLARAVEVNVLSERITPEALVTGLGGRDTSTGLVYAPELAVFLGRSKYLEGMVPLLTSLFDCPDTWKSTTIGRGASKLDQVALSLLGASTLEWFIEALPREAFSGGFMARLLFVVQEDTDREFAIPEKGLGHLWERLREQLEVIRGLRGEVVMHPDARKWYLSWYSKHHKSPIVDEKFAGYHERKPDHLLRIAYLLRVAETKTLTLHQSDLEHALHILDWMEASLPRVFAGVAATPVGAAHQRILGQLRKAGGKLSHSTLLRKNQHAMNARAFYEAITTLIESESVRRIKTATEHSYELIEGGE